MKLVLPPPGSYSVYFGVFIEHLHEYEGDAIFSLGQARGRVRLFFFFFFASFVTCHVFLGYLFPSPNFHALERCVGRS